MKRRLLVVASATLFVATTVAAEPAKYLRFQQDGGAVYGLLEGDRVRVLAGDLFGDWKKTDTMYALRDVKLLPPTRPTQVLALASNYHSHVSKELPSPQLAVPQAFFKSPSCLVADGAAIVIPKDAKDVHFEAELVIVIGKKCSKVSKADVNDYIFGYTVGNDVSERIWQNDKDVKDIQWWRAKGTDTFGPCGPFIVTGVDPGNLLMKLRVNGETKQEERTSQLIHDVPTQVSFISQYITLHPGDLIFTGTPGKTSAIKPGDVVEVEIEKIGLLRNPVVAAQ